jgi:hypothetical protein
VVGFKPLPTTGDKPTANTPSRSLRPDSKGRIALGALAKGVSSFRVHKEENGRVGLEPFVEIPEGERWLYKNPEAMAMLKQRLKEYGEGNIVSIDSFDLWHNDDV